MPPTPADLAGPRLERVGVFIDYENAHRTGHGCFARHGTPTHATVFNPVQIAERIVAHRKRPSALTRVHVYRGRPVPAHQPVPASAFDIQRRVWESDPRCIVHARDLKYEFPYNDDPNYFLAREKGIDVSLAVDLVAACIRKEYDAVVLFSNDTDLLPAVELAYQLPSAHIEIACWSGAHPLWLREPLRQKPPRRIPFCHYLNDNDFEQTRERSAEGI